jgi:hypothetical protein
MPTSIEGQFRSSLEAAAGIPYWQELVVAREAVRAYLAGLELRVDADDQIEFGGNLIKFSHARLIGVEAYLSLSWSIADRITEMAGRVLCTADGGALNEANAPKLVSHFMRDSDRKSKTAVMVFDSLRQTFGWAIALSYAIRNHFVHDGGLKSVEFFEGRTSADAFKSSDAGWRPVERKAIGYNVSSNYLRPRAAWPDAPRDDLRVLLNACEREMDDALGVLLASACNALAVHIGFMLGED